jgi:V8-like Glu-specific endopeptidase
MEFNLSKITGQIIEDGKVKGTGFLVNNEYFVTAKHNVVKPLEEAIEKEILINFKCWGKYTGKTINLKKAHERKIDCVIIKLDEEIFDADFTQVINVNTSINDFNFKVYGYPKEQVEGLFLKGTIISHLKQKSKNIDYVLQVDKEDNLQSYKGLSGSPITVNDFIVGILIQQDTNVKLSGISFNLINDILLLCIEYHRFYLWF